MIKGNIFFCYWVVNVWNSLPHYVVQADFINSFKSRFDKYWPIKSLMAVSGSQTEADTGMGEPTQWEQWPFLSN